MADDVLGYLISEVETLRSAVLRAGALSAKTLGPCADGRLGTILRYVPASPGIEEAAHRVLVRTQALARALYEQGEISAIEDARRQGLAAIDAFAVIMEDALAKASIAAAELQDRHGGTGRNDPGGRLEPVSGSGG